ncbi:lytic polysaccharide monooxygenase [Metabacillus indicus]|uniref:lytic polysaccharide monooxygenase n=1 Tax=Metabacillus indicus TaxID=246786 RepID=UPI003CF9FA7F
MVWKSVCMAAAALLCTIWFQADRAEAHGYIKSPESRSYKASLEKQTLGYTLAFEKYGSVINSPQSVEGLKGFPAGGPADGRIASGNGGSGQIDFVLDQQSASRWNKVNLTGGVQAFTWNYTAPHATAKWHYYITKKEWDPSKPLSRNDFELLTTVPHDGSAASNNLTHQVNVPTDRNGYHIILGVWDVADTANAFYQVIDVNLQNSVLEDKELPTAPSNVKATEKTFTEVEVSWNPSADNTGVKEYALLRNGERIGTTGSLTYTDKNVEPNKTYSYAVKAIDHAGNESPLSAEVSITTAEASAEDKTPPSPPQNLHLMNVAAESVELMWGASEDLSGIREYHIYRDGIKISQTTSTSYTDTTVSSNTTYSYTVKAVDTYGNISDSSNLLDVTTKEDPEANPEWKVDAVYTAGDKVTYLGNEYEALWWTQGNQPDKLNGWKLLTQNTILFWQEGAAYAGGSIVEYEGKKYRAKWWTMGENPAASTVWEYIGDM